MKQKKSHWQKKKRKLLRRWGHQKNILKKHFGSWEGIKKLFFHYWIQMRIFIGVGGIKPYKMTLHMLEQNADFIVLNKPAGALVHPTKFNDPDTILNGLLFHLGMTGNKHPNMPGPVSRLDRDTSGVILFAISKPAKSELGKIMMKRGFGKKYLTLVIGKTEQKGEITSPLIKRTDRNLMKVDENGKDSHTKFNTLFYNKEENVSFVEVEILTGRMHQIRIHMSSIGHPVVGDILYGDEKMNKHFASTYNLKRQFLHAHQLTWDDKKFIAPLPELCEKIRQALSKSTFIT
ncbi:hypothetical protein COB57_02210 [Candidatus Peregrinibacteria bacterium]|nr:MAG: hypothetical protein COB57_02210 [Candidatus Peregrinibacteria bacterium]